MTSKFPGPARGVRPSKSANGSPQDRGQAMAPIAVEGYAIKSQSRSNPSRKASTGREESSKRKRVDDPERRIEEWIVRSLDDEPTPSLNRVLDRMLAGSLARRRPRPGRDQDADVVDPTAWSRFRTDRRRGITVVTLLDSSVVKESTLSGLEAELDVLIAAGSRRIVLNFAGVERLSSRFVLTMARIARKCASTPGGRLRASNLRAEIAAIASLIPAIETFANEEAAIDSPWPGPPIVRPLPVSILSELTSVENIGVDEPTLELDAGREIGPYDLPDHLAFSPTPGAATAPGSMGLIVVEGKGRGRMIPLVGDRILIGREPGCHLRLDSPSVSRIHASIEIHGEEVLFRDLGSTNGSTLNGRTIRDRSAPLRHGDRIEIDSSRFLFSVGIDSDRIDLDAQVLDWLADCAADEEASPETIAETESGLLDGLKRFDLGEFSEILRCELVEDVVILTPLIDELDDESRLEPLRSAFLELIDRRAPRKVVINLAFVSRLSSLATGVLVAHHLRLVRSGGGLRCCVAQPLVASYLNQIRMPMLVELYSTLEDAVLTTW